MLLKTEYCGFATEFVLHGVAKDEIFTSSSAWRFLNPKFFGLLINFWELAASAEEDWNGGLFDITTEIPNVAPLAALEVCLSEALALLKISSISETGVTGDPWGFSLVLGLLEATLFQWSRQNSVQTLSIIKAGSMTSPKEVELQSPLPGNSANLLSLQETPLGCSLRMPGNLNVFTVFWMDQVK